MLSTLIPKYCLLCACSLARGILCSACIPKHSKGGKFCQQCGAEQLGAACQLCAIAPLPLRQCFSWDLYQGILQEVLQAAKYRPSLRLAEYLCQEISPHVQSGFLVKDWDLVIPVPSSRAAIRQRGFSLPSLLSQQIAEYVGIPANHVALKHHGSRSAQAALSGRARFSNVRETFEAQLSLKNQRILLVDDVFTTGATALSATAALLQAEAVEVDLFTIARASNAAQHRADLHRFIESMVRMPHGKIRSII